MSRLWDFLVCVTFNVFSSLDETLNFYLSKVSFFDETQKIHYFGLLMKVLDYFWIR